MQSENKLLKESFGRRFTKARAKAGLTQITLAEKTKFQQSEIALYEKGKRIPKEASLKRLAKGIGVDPEWLKYGDESVVEVNEAPYGKFITISHNSNDKPKAVAKVGDLNDDNKNIVQELVNELYYSEDPERLKAVRVREKEAYKKELKEIKKENRPSRAKKKKAK